MKTALLPCLTLLVAGSLSCAARYEVVPHEGELYRIDTCTGELWRARLSKPIAIDQNGNETYAPGFPKVKWEPIEEVTTLQALEATAGEKYPALQKVLRDEVGAGYLTRAQADEVLAQREKFEERRSEIEAKYPGKVVAVANGTVYAGDTLAEALDQVPDGPLSYVEEIPAQSQPQPEGGKRPE